MPSRAKTTGLLGACVLGCAWVALAEKPRAVDPGDDSGPLAPRSSVVEQSVMQAENDRAVFGPPPPPAPPGPPGAAGTPDGGAPADGAPPNPYPSNLPPAPSGTPAEREKWLADRVDEILARPQLGATKVGAAIVEIGSGRSLYARNQDALFNPASNAKLFTTAAALGLLGPEFRFKTSLHAVAIKNGQVQGDLFLRGSGDPSLVIEDLWKLVADLAASGVKQIDGNVAVDDTYFDDVRVGPAFEQKNEDYAFRAPAGAASLNYNACAIHVVPATKEGDHPKVLIEPASPYFNVTNSARTVAAKGKNDLSVAAKEMEGHTEIVVTGHIRFGAPEVVEHRRIIHPDLYAGYSLRELLSRRGIKVGSQVVRAPVPAGAKQLALHLSPPLGVLVREVNKQSNNFMAEQLLKTLGAEKGGKPGSWPKGVE